MRHSKPRKHARSCSVAGPIMPLRLRTRTRSPTPVPHSTRPSRLHNLTIPLLPTVPTRTQQAHHKAATTIARAMSCVRTLSSTKTSEQLDEFLDRGRAVLGDLGQQRDMLKGTQRRLYTVANTLGISGDTIRMVERRAKQDKWIFWSGVIIFFLFCWLVIHYLR